MCTDISRAFFPFGHTLPLPCFYMVVNICGPWGGREPFFRHNCVLVAWKKLSCAAPGQHHSLLNGLLPPKRRRWNVKYVCIRSAVARYLNRKSLSPLKLRLLTSQTDTVVTTSPLSLILTAQLSRELSKYSVSRNLSTTSFSKAAKYEEMSLGTYDLPLL
jgi:hypothetical protein